MTIPQIQESLDRLIGLGLVKKVGDEYKFTDEGSALSAQFMAQPEKAHDTFQRWLEVQKAKGGDVQA